MGTEESKELGQTFKSLRDYILWEINSGLTPVSTPTSLDDEAEGSSGLSRALRGKMRYLATSRSAKPA